jgi:hypothetical protein
MRSVVLLMTAALLGCNGEEEVVPARASAAPPGAVIRIGPSEYLSEPQYILDTQIDAWVETVALLEPEETRRSWRRKALTNISLPIAVAAALLPEERALAREEAGALRELLVSEQPLPDGAPEVHVLEGHGLQLHLPVWGTARSLPVGEWSGIVEIPGGFAILRRVSEDPQEGWKGSSAVTLQILLVHFIPAGEAENLIEDARAKLGVTPLDPPGWDGILPAFYEFE